MPNGSLSDSLITSSVASTSLPRKFTVVLVGDGGTGKSSYVSRLDSGQFKSEYIATVGIEVHTINFETNFGEYTLTIRDTAGQEKLGPLRDIYYENIDAAIIFFDVSSRVTYKNISLWHRDIVRLIPDIPVALCANKIDIKERKVKPKNINYHTKHCVGFHEISVKNNFNLKKPIEFLLQQITKESDLKIISSLGYEVFDSVSNLDIAQTDF